MAEILAVAGVTPKSGKSTVSLNLSASFSVFEKKTLMVDFDRISGISVMADVESTAEGIVSRSLYKNLDMIVSGFEETSFFKDIIANSGNTDAVFDVFRESFDSLYDYAVFDMPSVMDFMSISALAICDGIIIVIDFLNFDIVRIKKFLVTVIQINRIFKRKIKITGFLVNFFEPDLTCSYKPLPANLSGILFKTPIPYIHNMRSEGVCLVPECFKNVISPASVSYLKLCREIMKKNG